MKTSIKLATLIAFSLAGNITANAQVTMQTGGQKMPDEWIDKDTHHKVVRISRVAGSNSRFYFHNNPFYGNKMVFYNNGKNGRQIYTVDLKTLQAEQLTHQASSMNSEIVGQQTCNVYYQIKDSVFHQT